MRSWMMLSLVLGGLAGGAVASTDNTSTADHSKFEILNQPFASGPQVTEACLSCHTEASDQVMHSIHYQWSFTHPETGQQLGKSKVINSFCGSVAGNEPRCTSCHAGYDWRDMQSPPPKASTQVDCLACHDGSGQYTKLATGAGNPPLDPVHPKATTITGQPAWPVDLTVAAQSVGQPTRENCGNCHFYGGGGDNVKHGDLSSVLVAPSRSVDVHMSPEGGDFSCATCHVSEQHQWDGSRYAMHAADDRMPAPGALREVATCQSCHSATPHTGGLKAIKLNDHTDTLACQSCHIPSFARGGVATKTVWDWSTAGQLDAAGKPFSKDEYIQSDGTALHTYLSTKGDFAWGENVEPMYAWFDGQLEYTTTDMAIDPAQPVDINRITGSRSDGRSRIWPFKQMIGRQAYDTESLQLASVHVWGPTTETAFWSNFDWIKAISAGMSAAGRPFSGSHDFVDTHMVWPITHMVAPADEALDCQSCHDDNGRMHGITGIAMPGTDPGHPISRLGQLMVALTLLGVAGHAGARVISRKRTHKEEDAHD